MKSDEEKFIKLKSSWILFHDLPDTIQELSHDWRGFPRFSRQMTTPGVHRGTPSTEKSMYMYAL